jgi:hypothetical protein
MKSKRWFRRNRHKNYELVWLYKKLLDEQWQYFYYIVYHFCNDRLIAIHKDPKHVLGLSYNNNFVSGWTLKDGWIWNLD